MMLPLMHHVMEEGGEHLLGALIAEERRVEGDFIGSGASGAMVETLPTKIAVFSRFALHGDEARRECPAKKCLIEDVMGFIEAAIGGFGGGVVLSVLAMGLRSIR